MATMQTYDGFSPKINKIKEDNANNMYRAQPRQNTTKKQKKIFLKYKSFRI